MRPNHGLFECEGKSQNFQKTDSGILFQDLLTLNFVDLKTMNGFDVEPAWPH